MTDFKPHPAPDAGRLLEIIRMQARIAKEGLDLGGVLAYVTDSVRILTHADGAIVEFAEGDEMVYRALSGMPETLLGLRLKRSGSLSGLCVDSGEILYCSDSETDPRVDREACRRVGLRSMIVAPLIHNETVVGVLKISSAEIARFSAEDQAILQLTTEMIASAMYHAVKFETNALYHRATHDELTGLANRALYFDRLRQALSQAHRHSERIGVLNLDMDGLKAINDNHGHRAGDAAIREVATRIHGMARRNDTVARLGGDEFAMIMDRIKGRDAVDLHMERMRSKISEPFHFEGKPLSLGASMGAALFPDDGENIDALLEKADQAMYAIKKQSKMARRG